MNLDELRDRLHDQAGEIDLAEPAPIPVLRRRTKQLRRRRVAGAGVTAVCGALVVLVALNNGMVPDRAEPANSPSPALATPTTPPDGLPERAIEDAPGDYVRDGIRYRAKVADSDLLDAQIRTGPISFQWEPAQDLVDFRAFCVLPGRPAAAEQAKVIVRVGGRAVTSRPCTGVAEPEAGEQASIGVPGLGIQTTKPVQVTATVVDRNNRAVAGAVTGVGVYTRGPDRELSPGYWFPERVEHHGYLYSLDEGTTITPVRTDYGPQDGQQDSPGFTPYLLAFGTVGVSTKHTFELAGTPGGQRVSVDPADGPAASMFFDAVPAQAAGQIVLRQLGTAPATGDLVLARYLPE
ncbi:hypothetical protein [Kribbella sp. NPDC051770]|uniref:hypothetical protein n=1 Tax=Kribbella sp. NPDC051770 TaxID=3155413 RepID=UPI0034297381